MAVFKCKMCGGTIEFETGATVGVCDSCGTKQTLPRLDDDRRANLYDRANHFRRNNDFDKAAGIYEQILNEDNTDAEAYWSLVLCRYGIEYVEDPKTRKRIPTVNRAQFTSIYMDEDYKSALKYADAYQRQIYEEEAKSIDDIQKGILKISSKEEPFDVFICYKETDNSGKRTQDSVLATDLYHQLTLEGFKVFFAAITLEDKLGSAYEPYIFAALNSAKVMVVLGTKPEYFNAVWVKNEWSRYLSLVKNSGGKKVLIPAYKDMDPYDLPEEFSHLQAQDMAKLGFMQDLIRGIKKIVSSATQNQAVKETVVVNNTAAASAAPLLERAFLFLEDGKWQDANTYCEKVLDINPKSAEAYLGKLMAELKVKNRTQLADCEQPFDGSENYSKIIRFGDEKLESEIRGYISHINERNEKDPFSINNVIYNNAIRLMQLKNFAGAINDLQCIRGFKDADKLLDVCEKNIKQRKMEKEAESLRAAALAREVAREGNEKRRIADEKAAKMRKKVKTIFILILCIIIAFIVLLTTFIIPNGKYNEAMQLYNVGNYTEAMNIFKSLNGYKDSAKIYTQYELEKIKTADVGDIVIFGNYEQDNDKSNGKEQIEWIILQKDITSCLLISKQVLDCKLYNEGYSGTKWEYCSLREWLNKTFLNESFNNEEKKLIQITTVTADKNPEYDTNPGNDTTDKIFILSVNEADKYFSSNNERRCKPTKYAVAKGVHVRNDYEDGNCSWWLRTPGSVQWYAALVLNSGSIGLYGEQVASDGFKTVNEGVRPAMWISLDEI